MRVASRVLCGLGPTTDDNDSDDRRQLSFRRQHGVSFLLSKKEKPTSAFCIPVSAFPGLTHLVVGFPETPEEVVAQEPGGGVHQALAVVPSLLLIHRLV